MLRSMTGFGRGFAENKFGRAKIEIKSINNKFFEVLPKLPPNLTIFEDRIRELLQRKISRGRLSVFLNYDKTGRPKEEVHINRHIGKEYYAKITTLKKSLRLSGKIGIEQILALPGVVEYRPHQEDEKVLWPLVSKALLAACDDLIRSKAREGTMLKKNIKNIVDTIESSVKKIKQKAPLVVVGYKKRLLNTVGEFTGKRRFLNPERMEEEAAIFARGCDITEEIHRMESHIAGLKKALFHNGEAGRRIDFMAQEMYREANTMGAKANNFPISKEVIKIKSMIEKIREQVQNVE